MKINIKKIITILLIFSTTLSQTLACTSLTLSNKQGDVVSGRTMEWGLDWDWKLIYIPKGTQEFLSAPANVNLPKQSYITKYSILGTGLIKDNQTFLADGQNSQGLSISANYLPGFTQYQQINKNESKYVSIVEFVSFLLSQYSDVDQVKQALQQYKLWSDKTTDIDGVSPELHFLITDKKGNGTVVEYIKGKTKFYDVNSNVKVMTNSPTYDWHLINLRNYLNLNNQTIARVKISDAIDKNKPTSIQDINALGQGNGFLGLPGDYSPPSRFIKTAILGYYANNKGPKNETLVSKVTHILNNVDIAKGTVVEKITDKKLYDHTTFTVIKDLKNNKLYVKSYNKPNSTAMIDLNTLNQEHAKAFNIDISKLPFPDNNVTDKLLKQ